MNTRFFAWAFLLASLVGLNLPASAANSFDGSRLFPGTSGSLTTSDGTWTFSTTTGSGGNDILLNGTWVNARGVELIVGNGGQMYDFSASSHWYRWNGSSFGSALSGTPFPISANGSSMTPSSTTDLVTIQGIWAFSTATQSGGNVILLNGTQASTGASLSLLIDNGGQVYAHSNNGNWYAWSTTASVWNLTANPTASFSPYCASAVVAGLQWSAVSGAATYNISRNGSTIETGTRLLSYTDQGVKASTSYSYVLTALNSSGGTVSTQNLSFKTPAATSTGDPPYCPSNSIAGMTWNWSTGINQQDGSDLWDTTWGADGNTYVFFGDGGGFFGSDTNGRVSFGIGELTLSAPSPGTAPVLTTSNAFNVYGGLNGKNSASISGKVNGIIAVNSDFYGVGGIWEPSDPGYQAGDGMSGEPNHVEIVYSTGDAFSWTDNGTNWQFCNASMGNSSFCATSFVNFGAGNAGAIDGYIYILGATYQNFVGNGGLCNCTYLARVLAADILNYGSYQVLTGFTASGTPNFVTGGWSQMYPIFVDNGSRSLPLGHVVYNSALKRFIGTAQGFVNQAGFYDAPNPWGPWTTIGYYQSNTNNTGGWGNLGTTSFTGGDGDALGINFLNQWTSSDGLTMWATFSSDKTASANAYLTPLAGQDMDSFSLVSTTLSLF